MVFPPSKDRPNKAPFSICQSKQSKSIRTLIRSTFMPSGYPSKTPAGYLRYSVWSWIQDISTQLRSVLATQRILEGVGVGREGATALSALMNFLARDASGMLATLLFTSAASSRFRTDVKRWRLFADLMVDMGITLEVAALANPKLFLPMICVGNMCKAVCGVAAGACGGSINLHWAKGSDISDVNAKFGAQHTVTGGFGLVFAAVFARSVATWKLWRLWVLYSGLTILHIFANMRCMRLIAFDSLNHIRMHIILKEFFDYWDKQTSKESTVSATINASPSLSPPDLVTKVEPLFFLPSWLMPKVHALRKSSVTIHFGASFNDFAERGQQVSGSDVTDTILTSPESGLVDTALGDDGYLLSAGVVGRRRMSSNKQELCVNVVFLHNSTLVNEAKAYLHALLLGRKLKVARRDNDSPLVENEWVAAAEQEAQEEINIAWNIFQTSCEVAGWDLAKTEMQTIGYEISTILQES
jgi:hypothetical protein